MPLGFVSMYVEDVHILRIYDLVLSDLSTFFARHPQHLWKSNFISFITLKTTTPHLERSRLVLYMHRIP